MNDGGGGNKLLGISWVVPSICDNPLTEFVINVSCDQARKAEI